VNWSKRVYVGIVSVLPLLGLFLTFPLARTQWFLHHNNNPSFRAVGYGAQLRHADCEIVVFGDSTAIVGVDPQIVQRATGMKACNVSEIYPVILTAGFEPLDRYLGQNRTPRYLVVMLHARHFIESKAWNIEPEVLEGIEYLLRFDVRHSVAASRSHARYFLGFAQWAIRAVVEDAGHRAWEALTRYAGNPPLPEPEDPLGERQRRNGVLTVYHRPPETRCGEGNKTEPPVGDPAWIAGLRRKYSTNGTTVLVNVSPIADCEELAGAYERAVEGLHDNRLERLPVGMFNDQELHLTQEGAARVSGELAEQILAIERRRTSAAAAPSKITGAN